MVDKIVILSKDCFPPIDSEDFKFYEKRVRGVLNAHVKAEQIQRLGLPVGDNARGWIWHSTGRPPMGYHPDTFMGRGGRIGLFLTDGGLIFRHIETGTTETFLAKAGTCAFFPHDILEAGCPYLHASVRVGSGPRTVLHHKSGRPPA